MSINHHYNRVDKCIKKICISVQWLILLNWPAVHGVIQLCLPAAHWPEAPQTQPSGWPSPEESGNKTPCWSTSENTWIYTSIWNTPEGSQPNTFRRILKSFLQDRSVENVLIVILANEKSEVFWRNWRWKLKKKTHTHRAFVVQKVGLVVSTKHWKLLG